MIYGVSEAITRVVLRRLEKSRVSHSRLKRSSKNICLMESDWGKQVVQSTFGIVKHGETLTKTRPSYSLNRCQGREETNSHSRVLLGPNIAPHIPGFFGHGLGGGRMDSTGWTLCL
ncbi:unnamed protein product, partial [Prunus brigantina]